MNRVFGSILLWILKKKLNSSKEGLATKEAKLRLKQVGPNLISEHQKRNLLFQFLSRFRSPLVILLVLASVFSFFVGQIQDASIILTIVMFSVLIDFFSGISCRESCRKTSQICGSQEHCSQRGAKK